MKKERAFFLAAAAVLLLFLIPLPTGNISADGSPEYASLLYRPLWGSETAQDENETPEAEPEETKQNETAQTPEPLESKTEEEIPVRNVACVRTKMLPDAPEAFPWGTPPWAAVAATPEEFGAYLLSWENCFDFASEQKGSPSLFARKERYGEDYFKENVLVLLLLKRSDGPAPPRLERLNTVQTPNGPVLNFSVDGTLPEYGEEDTAEWHLLIEVKRSDLPAAFAGARLTLDGKETACGFLPFVYNGKAAGL